ncbi:MAG: methyltransferase [Candidatus Diapherotrites archaeon]|nr:methyltransferase [Candidatus Diapherotrites archaeon]
MVYPPREDSLLLAEQVRKHANGRVLDMGTGSAIQAEAAASKGLDVLCADVDDEAVKTAAGKGFKTVKSDLFSAVKDRFDTIVFNPPYLPTDPQARDPALDGGESGRELLDRFLEECANHLNEGGIILFIQSSLNSERETERKLDALGLDFQVIARKKIPWEELIVFKAWKRGKR